MMCKIGDRVIFNGEIEIWASRGKEYEVIGIKDYPAEPPKRLKRNMSSGTVDCDCDLCTKEKSAFRTLEIIGNLGKCNLHECCFIKIQDNESCAEEK